MLKNNLVPVGTSFLNTAIHEALGETNEQKPQSCPTDMVEETSSLEHLLELFFNKAKSILWKCLPETKMSLLT